MRLICPNCEAQYEVADNAIPAGGRDVQCSNCGNTWYQMPQGANGAAPAARAMTAPARPAAAPKATDAKPAEAPKAAEATKPTAAAVAEAAVEKPKTTRRSKSADISAEASEMSGTAQTTPPPEPAAEVAPPASLAEEPPAPAMAAPESPEPAADDLPQRKIDSSVLAVLREEAEREANRRKADAEAAEIAASDAKPQVEPPAAKVAKPDLTVVAPVVPPVEEPAAADLDDEDEDGGEAKMPPSAAVAKLQAAIATKPVEPESKSVRDSAATDAAVAAALAASLGEDTQAANRQGKGRELLPDIEEIKSSLRSATDDGAEETEDSADSPEMVAQKRHGFRRGFISALVVGLVLSSAYVSAPRIVALVPGSAGMMQTYVSTIDSARVYLDQIIRSATSSIEGDS